MKFKKFFQNWQNVTEYSANKVIYSAGNSADVLYFILSGEVELTLHGESIGIEKAGGIIGEMAMIKSANQSATATAISDVKLVGMDRKQLKQITKANNNFSIHVMAALANRLGAVDRYITEHITPTNN
jgi:CRP/FNR family cyclic AMP-dependent transcriptional regulator